MTLDVSLIKMQNGETRIKYHCACCEQKISVSRRHAGKEMKCPTCASITSVPDPNFGSAIFKAIFR